MSAKAAERQAGQPIDLYAIVRSEPGGRDALVGMDAIADGLRTIAAGHIPQSSAAVPGPT